MAEERSLHETLLDYVVYAPVGAAMLAIEEVPRLAEQGRKRLGQQLAIAKMVGKFAVNEGKRRVGTTPPRPAPAAGRSAASTASAAAEPPAPARTAQGARDAAQTVREPSTRSTVPPASTPGPATVGEPGTEPVGPAKALPIPGYDTLAASQVVERLASLSPAELEAVRAYESSTRRRRTVLHRVAQLLVERNGTAG